MLTRSGGRDIVAAPGGAVRANSQIRPKVAVSPEKSQVKGPLVSVLKTVVGPDPTRPAWAVGATAPLRGTHGGHFCQEGMKAWPGDCIQPSGWA